MEYPSTFGYLHHTIPTQWQQRLGSYNPRRPRTNAASQLFSIWMYQNQMRNLEDRRIVCASMAVAQHIARKRTASATVRSYYLVRTYARRILCPEHTANHYRLTCL